jgi:hypothetical protein
MTDEVVTRHEGPEVRIRRVLLFVATFLGIVVVLFGGLGLYYRAVVGRERTVTTPRAFPAPQLQPNPSADYANFHAAQERQLVGFAWADRDRGLVHIPIERAMGLIAGRGLRGYDPLEATPSPGEPAKAGAPTDGAPRAKPAPGVAPYGAPP